MRDNGTRYERNESFIYRSIVNEAVLVPIHQDVADMECIYTLNDLGAFIWKRMEHPLTWDELLVSVQDEYEVDPAVLAADLEQFIQDMTGIGAVRKV